MNPSPTSDKTAPEGGQVNSTVANTVDYQSTAGQGQQLRNVQVVHQTHNNNPASAKTSGGVLTAAAASAASSLQSAKEAISGK